MRYLKTYESSLVQEVNKGELQDICEMYLSYLIDADFEVTIVYGSLSLKDYLIIWLERGDEDFTWDEIKDSYIPFLQIISNSYIIKGISLSNDYMTGSDISSKEFNIMIDYADDSRNYCLYQDLVADSIDTSWRTEIEQIAVIIRKDMVR